MYSRGRGKARRRNSHLPALAVLAAALAFSAAPAHAAKLTPAQTTAAGNLSTFLTQERERLQLPGLAVAIVTPSGTAWKHLDGVANRAPERPVTEHTLFRVASITKLFTAALVIQARDAGRLRLGDPAVAHLGPGASLPVHERGGTVTIRHLLTHSSGLPPNFADATPVHASVERGFRAADLLDGLAKARADTPAGREYAYSNTGFALLGLIAERAWAGAYEDTLRQRLLEPLGITEAMITVPPELLPLEAVGYLAANTNRPGGTRDAGVLNPAGALRISLAGLARFLQWQIDPFGAKHAAMAPASVIEMQRPAVIKPGWKQAVGLAWHIEYDPKLGEIVYHTGDLEGFTAWIGFIPAQRYGVIALTNCGKYVDDLARHALEAAVPFGQAEPTPLTPPLLAANAWFEAWLGGATQPPFDTALHPRWLAAGGAELLGKKIAATVKKHGPAQKFESAQILGPRSAVLRARMKDGKSVRVTFRIDAGKSPRLLDAVIKP